MAETFQTPQGTFDVLPPDSQVYEDVIGVFGAAARRYNYGLLVSPMFEDIGVFLRVGASTDIVRKEMYEFEDRGGHRRALRPEGTASAVRAFIQHRPLVPWKVWYAAPSFRYERPQAGRYRQHHQLGVEALGTEDPMLDVEVIDLLTGFHAALGITRTTLHLTSLGDDTCRPAYREQLVAYLDGQQLCDEHRDSYGANPLRVLDCKRPLCIAATADAPAQVDHLCDPCRDHFAAVTQGLDALHIGYEIDRRLVRGLDYYTRTTFEVEAHAIAGAQNGLGGGGRYDALAEELGGPKTPGIGFGTGIERIRLALEAEAKVPEPRAPGAFVVDMTGGREAMSLTHELRAAGIAADRAWDNRSSKAQFTAANRARARVAAIVGADELARGVVAIKPLLGGGEQYEIPRHDVVAHLQELLYG